MLSRALFCFVVAVGLAVTCGSSVAASADDYFSEAQKYVAEGSVKSAIIELKNALQKDPTHVKSRLLLGSLYLRNGDTAAAVKEYGRARELGAADDLWMRGYARALVLQGSFQQLLDEVRVKPSMPGELRAQLLAMRGNAQIALRHIDEGIAEYDAALALEPGNPVARLGKAQIMLGEGREDEALAQFNEVLAENPGHVETRLARGDLRRRMHQLADAAADYQRAAEEDPVNPRARIGLALVHIAQRDIAAAKQDLEALNKIARDVPAVNYLRALVSFQEGDYDRASDELQTLLRVAPSNVQAQLLYGIVSYARNQFTIADDYLTRVYSSIPGNVQVAKILGATRLKLRQPDRAVQVLGGVVDANSGDAQLLALLGTAYIQSGNNSKGAEYIEKAVEIDPDRALLRTQLAIGKIASGDTSGAISQLESAVALDQDVLQADVLLVLSYLNKHEFDKAIAASEALEKRMVDSPIPYNLTGLAYLAQSRFDEAQAKFEQALEKDPNFLVAIMNIARKSTLQGDAEAAARAYERVLQRDPKHLGALLGMAALAKAGGDAAATEQWLLRANESNPKALQPMLILAEHYLRANEGLKAMTALSGLAPEQAEHPAALRLKGMAQLQSGDYPSAVFTFSTLTERQPELLEGWFQLARAQVAGGDPDAARDSFRRAIELDPEHKVPLVWIGLAELELRENRYDQALEQAKQIKTYFPDNVYGYDIEAAAYRGKGDIEASLAATEAGLAVERTSRRVRIFANALTAAGKADKGIKVLNDWLAEHSDDGSAWANLGMLQQQAGRAGEAIAAYEQAISKVEVNPVILNNMAWLYLERDGKRALELATRAYELAPSRAEIVDTYGWILFQQGRAPEGLAALQQAFVIAPRNAEIGLHVAEALHRLDRDSEARPVLERIVRENPNTQHAEAANALLQRLRG